MNPKAVFLIMLIALIIYLGMTQKQAVCNPPYILRGIECCIDSNQDGLCDKDQPEAFGETSTALDPCIGLSGYNKTACLFDKEKRRYAEECAVTCDNASSVCRSECDVKEPTKEKIACADTCFKNYTACYSGCGVTPQAAPSPKPSANASNENRTVIVLPKIF
jgi:hypothetical protein